jgi:hypothetical protein
MRMGAENAPAVAARKETSFASISGNQPKHNPIDPSLQRIRSHFSILYRVSMSFSKRSPRNVRSLHLLSESVLRRTDFIVIWRITLCTNRP